MSKTTHVVYAGSFDPITNGHLWMIEQAAYLFDQVTVAIGVNPEKKTAFTIAERLDMITGAVAKFPNVKVAQYENMYLVDYARQIGADAILRGIRNDQDYGYERGMRYVNEEIGGQDARTVFMMPPREYAEISSSFVKNLVGPKGWDGIAFRYIPYSVWSYFWGKFQNSPMPIDQIVESVSHEIIHRYREPHRHYHIVKHVSKMLDHSSDLEEKGVALDYTALNLAIWLHDSICDPTRSDNEEQSADLGDAILTRWKQPEALKAKVRRLTLATKHTAEIQHSGDDLDTDQDDVDVLIDIDLSIFGVDQVQFHQYEMDIRKEYGHIDDVAFARGRADFVQKMLARERIFRTAHFAHLEETARANLRTSLDY